jgi:hypothetical protein
MKYLKKFNEELESETYLSAAEKLRKKGHLQRGKSLELHSTHMKWKKMKEYFERWGACELYYKNIFDKNIVSNFYIGIDWEDESTLDSIASTIDGHEDHISLYFSMMAIPVDPKSLGGGREDISDRNDFFKSNGFYVGKEIAINYDFISGELKFKGIDLKESSHRISLSRRAAVILKKQLLACFEEGGDYNTDYHYSKEGYHYSKPNEIMHDVIRDRLNDELDFSLKFNYTMKDIYNDIKNYSINDLYKK